MEYRALANTDLKVSRLSLGTLTFGNQVNEAEALPIVERALAAGINFLDTSNSYSQGGAETILGKALAGRRHEVILATKVGNIWGRDQDERGLSRAAVLKAIDASLERLRTDYVDVYYLHLPDRGVPIEETLSAVHEVVRAGKVRYPAISNYAAWRVCEIDRICEKNGFQPPRISQNIYNLLTRDIEDEFLPFCRRFGMGLVTFNPLAGGLLTGKHTLDRGLVYAMKDFVKSTLEFVSLGRFRARRWPLRHTRYSLKPFYMERFWHRENLTAVEELARVAREAGKTLTELSLQWLMSRSQVDSTILGVSHMEQLEENLKACDGRPLDDSTLAHCDAVWKRLRGVNLRYYR